MRVSDKDEKLNHHTENTDYLLSIDNGTQSIRALLFDCLGNLVAKGQQLITPYFSAHPGWAEQEPDYYWLAVKQACDLLWRDLAQRPDISKEQIIGMSVTTQRGTVINLDASGKPLRPAIIWLDQRHGTGCSRLPMSKISLSAFRKNPKRSGSVKISRRPGRIPTSTYYCLVF